MKTNVKTICGVCVAALTSLFAGCNPVADTKLAQATSTQFLQKMQAHQYQQAYQLTSSGFQGVASTKKLASYWDLVEKNEGKVKSWSQTGVNVSSFNFKTTVQLSYTLQCQKGTSNIAFAISPEKDKWLIDKFNVNF